jgi:retron-type reverse transcriptase
MKKFINTYESITSIESVFAAWRGFEKGKMRQEDVSFFALRLMDNLFALQRDLEVQKYRHGSYKAFTISDPKSRSIHKASVRDRVVHHLLYQALYPYFDTHFIYDSYSCRDDKGTHRALGRFNSFGRKVSQNSTRTCWVLKCDIRKFFASIDHATLKSTLIRHIEDQNILSLLSNVINSFETPGTPGVGLPLGNLTSQLLVNIYMNEFDQFVKHELMEKYYIRYADDFVFLSEDRRYLEDLLPHIDHFLSNRLKLLLHPNKVFIKTLSSGVDFLGWVHFPTHRVLRTATKKRMLRRLVENSSENTRQSYMGMLSHGDAYKLTKGVLRAIEFAR